MLKAEAEAEVGPRRTKRSFRPSRAATTDALYPDYQEAGRDTWTRRFVAALSGVTLLAFVAGCGDELTGKPKVDSALLDTAVDYRARDDASGDGQTLDAARSAHEAGIDADPRVDGTPGDAR